MIVSTGVAVAATLDLYGRKAFGYFCLHVMAKARTDEGAWAPAWRLLSRVG
jgi:hypothetical protein